MARRGINPALNDLSVDNIAMAPGNSYDDMSGLASFTHYSPLDGDRSNSAIEDEFVDEADSSVPYSKQKRGHG